MGHSGPPLTDGYDAFSWIAAQPWSNGKVGTIGCSSTAEWQMAVASLGHPAFAAMIPQGFGAGVGRVGRFHEQGNWYRGGAVQMLFIAWLYGVQNTQRPVFPPNTSQEDLVRLSRYFDLVPQLPAVQGGAFDQSRIERRPDVLVYTSDPMPAGLEVTGEIELTLYVSSDAPDTDFTVKLIDVQPDGRAFNLDETIQRMRYREGYDREVRMQPGEVYRVVLGPMMTSNWFGPGHRIRIEVSSSNFPRFDRNLNTGGRNHDEARGVVANNAVHHSARHPSALRLTVVRRPGTQ